MSKRTKAGRNRSLRAWAKSVHDTGVGLGRVVVLAGAPGVGKSTLLRRVAHEATLRGTTTLYVSADEDILTTVASFSRDRLNRARLSITGARTWKDVEREIALIKPGVVLVDGLTRLDYDAKREAGGIGTTQVIVGRAVFLSRSVHGPRFVVSTHTGRHGALPPFTHSVDTLVRLRQDGDDVVMETVKDSRASRRPPRLRGALRSRRFLGEMAMSLLKRSAERAGVA